ncbi:MULTISPECIES: ABC transporter ATP-binding protein [Thermotoga]|jgi:putative ABC transport system ATP-binding protein|uniref:ABC transporter related n=3 Tax=Thermotoga petrophila TaxID=93929 RepID=A5IK66_THEP1|nr:MULTISPECIES: ABC transporter ATP-binding protein [Thermotoga]KUK22095.1 MAG: putative ABC transporter ATP-binding protein [Thermotoga petrophila]KUK32817.1 MAG: putative ABC transporter ATP-binding protein [Thermotoga sp. 47_83]ABQ46589.1 ABC transporter related [Thermotoga petrophila RKU-1]ACB08937.1 ABC transporter related [Thermotoga sp. RQ2]ADA67076.1 ABC transporter related protein [Thermotoga petrophila RKU-10]
MKKVMELVDVWKIYDLGEVKVEALRGVSFEVFEGEYVIIIGPSGSGKSTLLHILGCLDRPTKGKVLIEGEEVSRMGDRRLAQVRNRKIGFVFQSYNLLPRLTALENVELPMIYAGVPAKERKRRAKELLELVGLGDRLHHRPNQLSGGQQQRVAIARALANDPVFILADEPTGNLDTKTGEEILELFRKLHEMGKTLVVVTHNLEMVDEGTCIVRIRDGKIEGVERRGVVYGDT